MAGLAAALDAGEAGASPAAGVSGSVTGTVGSSSKV
jgi:hypothetical protein